jgi:hypothetical protein
MPPAHPSLSGTTILGPPISIATHLSAHPSPFYTVYRPSHLKVTHYLGPSVSIAAPFTANNIFLYHLLYHMPPAHPSISGTTILGPPISIATHLSAHPSYTLPRPIRLHHLLHSLLIIYSYTTFYTICLRPIPLSATTTLGPPVSNTTITPAHPSLLYLRSRPIHLHFTLFMGPSVSIIHSIHY